MFSQKALKFALSSSLSVAVGWFLLLCWSLTFLIIFHQSGVVAMICSMRLRSLFFLCSLFRFLVSSAPILSRVSLCMSAFCPLAVSTLYFQCAILCYCRSLMSSRLRSPMWGRFLVASRASCIVVTYQLYRSSTVLKCASFILSHLCVIVSLNLFLAIGFFSLIVGCLVAWDGY